MWEITESVAEVDIGEERRWLEERRRIQCGECGGWKVAWEKEEQDPDWFEAWSNVSEEIRLPGMVAEKVDVNGLAEVKKRRQEKVRKMKEAHQEALVTAGNKGGRRRIEEQFPTKQRPKRRPIDWETATLEVNEWVSKVGITIGRKADNPSRRERAARLLYTWRDLFATDIIDIRETDLVRHRIPLLPGAKPEVAREGLYTTAEHEWMRTNFPQLEQAGIICLCTSPWSSKAKFVAKESGKLRMVNIFCPLNDATAKETYPMQRHEFVLDTIFKPGYDVYFACDGSNAYWGVPIVDKDRYKTAFNTPLGQFCMRRMGQGLTGAPFTYAKLTNLAFGPIPSRKYTRGKRRAAVSRQLEGDQPGTAEPALEGSHPREGVNFTHFMDDTYGSATGFEAMFTFLDHHFFPRCDWARFALNPGKSVFFEESIKVLGFEGGKGLRPKPARRDVFKDYPVPKSYKEVEAFLYLTPFLRRFIPGRAEHARILKDCMVEQVTEENGKRETRHFFVWGERQQHSFDHIRQAILRNTIYSVDPDLQIHVAADASMTGMGAVVFQLAGSPPNTRVTPTNRKHMQVIAYISIQFTPAESRYSNSEREALAIVKALKEVRAQVVGSKFPIIVYTDHSALTTLLLGDDTRGKIANWQNQLAEYDVRIVHVPAREMQLADGLSRLPPDAMDSPRAEPDEAYDHRIPSLTLLTDGTVASREEEGKSKEGGEREVNQMETENKKDEGKSKAGRRRKGRNEATRKRREEKGHWEEVLAQFLLADVHYGQLDLEGIAKQALKVLDGPEVQGPRKSGSREEERIADCLTEWRDWLESEWYGGVLRYQISGVVGNELNPEDGRWKRWVKRRAKRFVISEVHGKVRRLLYRENNGQLAFCILPKTVPKVLLWLHDFHGHFSVQATLRKALGRVYWPSRSKDIAKFCGSCHNCQLLGPIRKNRRQPHPTIQLQPMDLLGIDFVGPISPATQLTGCKYILVIVDYFSRMCWLKATPKNDSHTSAVFMMEVCRWMGHPKAVYSDGGSHFKLEFSNLLQDREILQFVAPPYHPQSVGLAEMVVQLVMFRLRKYHVSNPDDVEEHWDQYVPNVEFCLNNRDIIRFNYTPARIMFGRTMRGLQVLENPSEAWVSSNELSPSSEGAKEEDWADRCEEFLALRDEERFRVVTDRLVQQDKSILEAKQHREANPAGWIKVGDLVLLRKHEHDKQHGRKLEEKWEGPYVVDREVKTHCLFILRYPESDRVCGRFSVDSLKPYVQRVMRWNSSGHWVGIGEDEVETAAGVEKVKVKEFVVDVDTIGNRSLWLREE